VLLSNTAILHQTRHRQFNRKSAFQRRYNKIRGGQLSDDQDISFRLSELETGHKMIARDVSRFEESVSNISRAIIELVEIKRDFAHFIASSEANNRHHAERHDKQDILLERMNDRLDQHDIIIPQLQETRSWILIAIGLIVSAVIVALIALVVR
jgi:hypothetical protein